MQANLSKQEWNSYINKELLIFRPFFIRLGIILDTDQLHVTGERYLMSGKKLVLTGTYKDDKNKKRIIVKVSSDDAGRSEIRSERKIYKTLQTLPFANSALLFMNELDFEDAKIGTLLVTEFIEQPKVYAQLTLLKQFHLASRMFEEQEGFNVTIYEHEKLIKKIFSIFRSNDYLKEFKKYKNNIKRNLPDNVTLHSLLERAQTLLTENKDTTDRYSPYLTHTDLAPHNMRVSDHGIFLLDYSSFAFGNKYEGWARFLNYMLIHNPKLERLLCDYLRDRGQDEYLSLQLMRIYKIVFLLEYYTQSLTRTTGNLHRLTKIRIDLCTKILESILDDTVISKNVIDTYINTRNKLRTKEEAVRQREFDIV